jgi:hypothetical protein
VSEWTHAGEWLPWLRGQAFHVAAEGTEFLVRDRLGSAGFEMAVTGPWSPADGRYSAVAEALRLPPSTYDNLDALLDTLRDLPRYWPDSPRLALLWTGAGSLVHADLLAWTELAQALVTASDEAWSQPARPMILESIAFVDAGDFGADRPSDE